MHRVTLRLTLSCSNSCMFCAQQGVSDDRALDVAARIAQLRTQSDEVTFVGGEPTLADDLVDIVRTAKEAGFLRIGLQTNGHALNELAPALAQAGLTDVHATVLGATADVHDYHTGNIGSFSALTKSVAACRQAGLEIVANTLVCRSNFRVLDEIPVLLQRWGVVAWLLQTPHTAGRAAENFDRVVPRLALALPYALHALAAARTAGLPTWIRGAPLCLLGPFAERALPASKPRTFAPVCDGCAAKSSCDGVDAVYMRRFSEEELKALPGVASIPTDHESWQRMFVGAGEMVWPSADVTVPLPPKAARKHLPTLHRAQPAEQEVARGADKRSGDDLVEIFPALWKTESKKNG